MSSMRNMLSMIPITSRLYRRVSGRIYQPLWNAGRSRGTQGRYLLLSRLWNHDRRCLLLHRRIAGTWRYSTQLTELHWLWSLRARFGYGRLLCWNKPRYVRDTILTLEDQRQAWLLLTAYFSFKGGSEMAVLFFLKNLRKELKELEKD